MTVIFILQRQALLNRLELDYTREDSRIAINVFLCCVKLGSERLHVFLAFHDFHV